MSSDFYCLIIIHFRKIHFLAQQVLWSNFLEGHNILSQENFDEYIFSVWYKLIHFSLPLNTVIHRIGKAAKILCPSRDVKNKNSLKPILYFIASCPKLIYISSSELINLNYSFNIPFKKSQKSTKVFFLNSMMVYS